MNAYIPPQGAPRALSSETTQVRRKATSLVLEIEKLDYHLLKPRTSRHPVIRGAYELWRSEWQATLHELDGLRRLHSDEFGRLDEISVICIGPRCISLTGLRWLDMSMPMAREDSYFQHWPEEVMSKLGQGLVGVVSNLVIHSEWRRALIDPSGERPGTPSALALATLMLAFRRFMASPAEHVIGVSRNDRAMNRVAATAGAATLGKIKLHGIDSDLMLLTRDSARTRGPVSDVLWIRRYQE